MILLFRILYTYQTIGKEIIKEQNFQHRVECLRTGDEKNYKESIEERNTLM